MHIYICVERERRIERERESEKGRAGEGERGGGGNAFYCAAQVAPEP